MFRYKGIVYRAHDPQWSFDPVSGAGAQRHGGRFNRPGIPTLYLSEHYLTALTEVSQGGLLPPTTVTPYTVDCDDVVDLTTARGRRAAGVRMNELDCHWEAFVEQRLSPPSWELADRLIGNGAAGILVASFAAGATGRNLVLWRFGPDRPHQVICHDPAGRLPKDQSSWPRK